METNLWKGYKLETGKGDLSFLCVTHCPDLIYIPIKLQDISNGYRVMACTKMEKKINGRGISWKLRKCDLSFLSVTHCPDPIHIPIKLPESRYS